MPVLPEVIFEQVDVCGHVATLLVAGAVQLPLVHIVQLLGLQTGLVRLGDLLAATLRVADEVEELVWVDDRRRGLLPLFESIQAATTTVAMGWLPLVAVVRDLALGW